MMTNNDDSGLIGTMRPLPRVDPTLASRLGQRDSRIQGRSAPASSDAAVFQRSMERVLRHEKAAPPALVEALWNNPNELVAPGGGQMLKDGDRCTVVRLSQIKGVQLQEPLVIKRYNLKGGFHTAMHLLLRSRAAWGWLNGMRLLAAGLRTPRPVASIEDRRWGVFKLSSWLVNEFIPGRPLRDVVDDPKTTDGEMRDLAVKFASIWRTLGLMRIGHGDMKATNFMVDRDRSIWLIDLDGMRTYRSSAMLRRERRKDLARFMKNWQGRPEVAAIFRARIGTG